MIPSLAKIGTRVIIGIVFILIALVRIPIIMMRIINHLKRTMMLNHPGTFFSDKGTQDFRSKAIMILGG